VALDVFRLVALAGHLFDAQTIGLHLKRNGGLEPATENELKGFREMVRVVFDDVAAIEAKAEKSHFEALPPGTHHVKIITVEPKTSSNGNDGLVMLLKDIEGRSVWNAIWFTPKTEPNVLRFAKAIGCDPKDGVALELTPEAVTGRRAVVTVVEEDHDGELRAAVDYMSWQPPTEPNDAWVETPQRASSVVDNSDIPF